MDRTRVILLKETIIIIRESEEPRIEHLSISGNNNKVERIICKKLTLSGYSNDVNVSGNVSEHSNNVNNESESMCRANNRSLVLLIYFRNQFMIYQLW